MTVLPIIELNSIYMVTNQGLDCFCNIWSLWIEITEKSGCRGGQICHHKVMGKTNWGKSDITLKMIEDANDRGINIKCDQYPYTRAMTLLMTVLPPWVHVGGVHKILERLQNPVDLEKIKRDINAGSIGWDNWIAECGWNGIFVSNVKSNKWKDMEGKSIAEIMQLAEYPDEFTVLFEILVDEKTLIEEAIKIFQEPEWNGCLATRLSLPEVTRRAEKLLARLQDLAQDPAALTEEEIDGILGKNANRLYNLV